MATYIITDNDTGQRYKVSGVETEEEAYAEFEAMPKDAPDPSLGEQAAGLAATVGGGATLGFLDELAGAGGFLGSLMPGGRSPTEGYVASRDAVRELQDLSAQQNPWLSLAGEMGGGALTGGLGLKAVQKAAPALSKLKQLATTGAIEGGIAGAGGAEEVSDVPINALIGAGLGGALGGAMGKLEGAIMPHMAGAQSHEVARLMTRGKTPRDAANEMRRLNAGFAEPWAMGADISPGAAQAGLSSRPPNAARLEDALRARNFRQGPLLEDAARKITGVDQSRVNALDDLIGARSKQGKQMYDPLRGQSVDLSEDLLGTLDTSAGKEAAQRALQVARDMAGNQDLELDDVLGQFDFWHNYQQVLRDLATGKMESGRALSGIESSVVRNARQNVMDEMFGQQWGDDYRAATDRFRENSALIDAMKDSEKFQRLPRDQVRKTVAGMNDEERAAFGVGVVNDMVEKALRNPDTADMATKMVRTPALRENLREVLGEAKVSQLDDAMRRLAQMIETNNAVLRGSQTQPRQAMREIAEMGRESSLRDVLNFQFGDALYNFMQPGGKAKISEDLVSLALQTDPQEFQRLLEGLEGRARRTFQPAAWATGGILAPVASDL